MQACYRDRERVKNNSMWMRLTIRRQVCGIWQKSPTFVKKSNIFLHLSFLTFVFLSDTLWFLTISVQIFTDHREIKIRIFTFDRAYLQCVSLWVALDEHVGVGLGADLLQEGAVAADESADDHLRQHELEDGRHLVPGH